MAERPAANEVNRRTFTLGRGMWGMTVFTYAFFMFIGAIWIGDVLTSSRVGGMLFSLAWVGGVVGTGAWLLLAEPRRVEVLDDGLRFVAPGRAVVIPWAALRSVSSPVLDLNRQSLHWRFGRRRLHTWGPYDQDFQELLRLVRKHAPSADLQGAETRRPTWGRRRSPPSRWVEPSG